jgi:adenylosuccinate synthase
VLILWLAEASRSGIRVSEIFNEPLFEVKIRELARAAHKRWGELLKDYDVEEEITKFKVSHTRC